MPIAPELMRLYPGGSIRSPEWLAIVAAIRARSGNLCEGAPAFPDCRAPNGAPHPVTGSTAVLTVAHLDHDPTHNDPDNLRHLCQRCHNTHDRLKRWENAKRTLRSRRAIGDLFEGAR